MGYDWPTTYGVMNLAISIEDYCTYLKADERYFMGAEADTLPNYQCADCWTLTQRSQLAYHLQQAQEMIEDELEYSIMLRGHSDETTDPYVRHPYSSQIQLGRKMLYTLGSWSVTSIGTNIVVDLSADPAVVTFDTTCDLNKIEITYVPDNDYYSGATVRIQPKVMTKSGNTVTAKIPWARLLKFSVQGDTCVDYEDTDNYITAVNAQCRDINCTTPLTLVWLTSNVACSTPCGTSEQLGCGSVLDNRLGIVQVEPATWNGATFVSNTPSYCNSPTFADISYIEGLYTLPYKLKAAIIRLAHSLMPSEPCGCQIMQAYWKEDRGEAPVLAKETCPWGMMAGAWFAWNSLMRYRIGEGDLLSTTFAPNVITSELYGYG